MDEAANGTGFCRERMVFVSQTTKRALEASLKKLLLEKPLNKITINDITEDCGVNRMTFYYHFKDIYDLVDWILMEDAAKALEGRQSFDTWTEAFLDILHQLQDNKTLVLNVYRSVGREQVEQYLYKIAGPCAEGICRPRMPGHHRAGRRQAVRGGFLQVCAGGHGAGMDPPGYEGRPGCDGRTRSTMIHGDLRRALCRLASNRAALEQDG